MIMELVNLLVHYFTQLGIYGVFLSMFIENIGIPLPTELGYLIAQNFINQGKYSYVIIITILTLGHLTGSIISYGIGRYGDNFVKNKLQSNNKIHKVHKILTRWYKNYGTVTVFLTRFIGYIRPWSSFIAGFANVPFIPFVLWTALGSFIFNLIALYLSNLFSLIWRTYSNLHLLIIILVGCLFFASFIYWIFKNLYKKIFKIKT